MRGKVPAQGFNARASVRGSLSLRPGLALMRALGVGLGLALAVPGLVLAAEPTSTNATLRVGDSFPDLTKFELEGKLPASLQGKVVVVDFWASWCGPCRRTFPLMEELHQRFSRRGLVILTINEDKSRIAMDEFLKENPVTFAVLRDAKRKLASRLQIPALPVSYVLDGTGRVRSIQPGARTARNGKAFAREIEALLKATDARAGAEGHP